MSLSDYIYHEWPGVGVLYLGDCRDAMKHLGPVDSVVTDPPYGIEGGRGGYRSFGKSDYRCESWEDTRDYVNRVAVPSIEWAVERNLRVGVTPGIRCMWDYPEPIGMGCFWLPAAVTHGPWGFTCFTPILYYGRDHRAGIGQLPSGIQVCEPSEKNGHPCPKPIGAWTWLVQKLSGLSETVLDPFLGSGTTAVACIRTGRRFIGIEIEPKYCAIAKARIDRELQQPRLPFVEPPRDTQKPLFDGRGE